MSKENKQITFEGREYTVPVWVEWVARDTVQDPHREAAFAKAYTLLVEYFSEKFDGY